MIEDYETHVYMNGENEYAQPVSMNTTRGSGSYSPNPGQRSMPHDNPICTFCKGSLAGRRYILKDESPCCIQCYDDRFAHTCFECRRKIGTESKDLSYRDQHWHEKCFFCATCKTPLVEKPFGSKDERLYCGECFNQQFASRCDKCNQIFRPGTKKLEYHSQQFHEHCFTCFVCSQPIGTKQFIPKDRKSYCVPCYQETFGSKCTGCSRVIPQGGVIYKSQPWHRECFKCSNCDESLAGQRFTSRDDRPYCSNCFARLFAKQCFACNRAITGEGGTRYISFEDRHWHTDCFKCRRCNSSLVGRGFLTEGREILCPKCGQVDQQPRPESNADNDTRHTYMNTYQNIN